MWPSRGKAFERIALIFQTVCLMSWLNDIYGLRDQSFKQCCLGFLLLSIFPHAFIAWCLKRSQKSPFNQNKPQGLASRSSVLSNQANVSKHMFDQTLLLFTLFLTSFICFRLSLIVKGLPMSNFNCETCFCQIFWQCGTEFLHLA